MANLTNSGKLIAKIEDIDSKIGSIPAGTDIGQEISDIQDSIGNVPAGSSVMDEISAVDDKIGNLPTGQTAADAIAAAAQAASDAADDAADVASDLAAFETTVASTYATKAEITAVYKYKGSVANYAALPVSGQTVGDVYNVEAADSTHGIKAGDNVAWNGTAWDVLAGTVDLSNYYTKAEVDSLIDSGGSAVSALETRVTTAEGKITTLEGKATTAESDIDALESRMDTAEDDIDAVEGDVTTLQGQMTTANGNITTLQGQMTTANGNITTLQSDVSTLQSDVSDIQTAIAASLPFEAFYMDVVLNGAVTTVSNAKLTATSQISFVVKSGTLNGYYLEKEVAAGSATFTSNVAENATLEVLVINKKSS